MCLYGEELGAKGGYFALGEAGREEAIETLGGWLDGRFHCSCIAALLPTS